MSLIEIVDIKVTDYHLILDVWMVDQYIRIGNIPISPRWNLLSKIFKFEISSVYKYDVSMYHLMFISIIDVGYNEYRQRCNLIRLTYGRTNN